jgi:hypothetical protein
MEGLGAGLGALAFWGFIGAICVAGIWYGLRERQAQYETLRHMIDSGQPIDEALVEKVLGGKAHMDQGLKVAGLIVIFAAPGLAVLGYFIRQVSAEGYTALLGIAGLAAFVGAGLLVASRVAERSGRNGDSASVNRTMPR